jgi:iron complex transport system ATP-binding protein
MLLDEPTAYLDLPRRVEMMQILRRLAHDDGRTILLSTHDLDLALRNADIIWLMVDGRIQVGAPEDLVLSGAFAAAFAAEGVTFDPLTGSFPVVVVRSVSPYGNGELSRTQGDEARAREADPRPVDPRRPLADVRG